MDQRGFALVLFGLDIAMFCFGAFKAMRLFRNGCKMLTFLGAGLVCGMIQASVAIGMVNYPVGALVLVFSPFWFILIQTTTWIYVFRIQTLRVMSWMDPLVGRVPWLILAGQIPVIILFNLDIYLGGALGFTLAVGLTYDAIVIVFEVGLFVVLLRKVLCLLEHRPLFKARFKRDMTAICVVIVLSDIARMTAFILAEQPLIIVVSATTYLFRLIMIPHFYEILVDEVRANPLGK